MDAISDSSRYNFANVYASLHEPHNQRSSSGSASEPVRYAGSDDSTTCRPSETPLDMKALRRRRRVNLPRFLFRAYYAGSGLRNMLPVDKKLYTNANGTSKLNSERKITPHAFVVGRGHRDVAEIRNPKQMVEDHIGTRPGFSEFSSWSPSLLLVLCYAESLYRLSGKVSSHVCIIDTEKVTNSAYSVPDIFEVGLADSKQRGLCLSLEYLLHGVIKGPGFVALEWSTIRSSVFLMHPEIRNGYATWGHDLRVQYFHPAGGCTTRRTGELGQYLRIAQQFGNRQFILPHLVKLYCLRRRWPDGISVSALSYDQDFLYIAR